METLLANLGIGFGAVLAFEPLSLFGLTLPVPMNLVYAFLGAFVGTMIGVLPGLGPLATIAMLLPATYALPPLGGLIMLAGIYYGAQYGGSTTSILVNLPGEVSSVITCVDGYQMARRGRAGVALTTAALGSFFAGCVATVLVAAFAAPLTEIAFEFGPAEYFSLMVLGLISAVVLASGSVAKAMRDGLSGTPGRPRGHGCQLGGVALCVQYSGIGGWHRFGRGRHGRIRLRRGDQERGAKRSARSLHQKGDESVPDQGRFQADDRAGPSRHGARFTAWNFARRRRPILASFGAYALEKKVSKNSAEFGKGAIEGVAAPESANNAAAQTSFIPLLTLGIPSNAVMAMMVGAMMIHNIQPGPQVMTSNPTLFWGLIVSMWIGNLMLVVLNLPLIGIWVKCLMVPYRFLYPAILVFCSIGAYTVNNNTFDVLMTAGFGLLGYVFIKLGCEVAPLLLGFVLGPMMEENFRRSLLLSRGDFTVFFTSPLSLALLGIAVVLVVIVARPAIKSKREEAFRKE